MATQDAAALRAARQKRIAARTDASGNQSNTETPTNESARTAAPGTKAAPVSAPSVLIAAVLDPDSVPRTAEVDLISFTDRQDPHWVVLADGRPVAEIRLSDQEEPAKIAKMFIGEQYAEGVREAAKQFSFSEVLAGVRARPYQASVSGEDAYKSIEATVRVESETALREAKANLRDNMSNMLNLVILAQAKNFLQENPLKDELFRRMTEAGIVDEKRAVAIIEAAYQARAPEHFDTCFKQASKWMDLHPQVLTELEDQIKGLGYRHPHVADADDIRAASGPSGNHNVPLTTRTAGTHVSADEKESMRDRLGFRRRHNQ